MNDNDPSRGLRLTEHLVSILNVLSERGAREEWTTIADLLSLLPHLQRYQIKNALRATYERGITERTAVEPYRYRLRKDLPEPTLAFIERARSVWEQEFGDGGSDAVAEPAQVAKIIVADVAVVAERQHIGEQTDRRPTVMELPYGPGHFVVRHFSIGKEPRVVGGTNVLKPEILRWLDDRANITGAWTYEPDFAEGRILFDEDADAAFFKMRWMGEGN